MSRSLLHRSTIFAAVAILATPMLVAQSLSDSIEAERLVHQRMRPRIGLYFGAAITRHTGDFQGLPEAPNCLLCDSGSFTGGSETGMYAGVLLLEVPIDPVWRILARAGYYTMSAVQSVQRSIGPLALPSGNTATGISEYTFDARLGMVGGSLTLGMRPTSLPITLRAGCEVGIFVSRSVTQSEELVAPSSATFVGTHGERTQMRNIYTSDLANPQAHLAAIVGIDYELAMNRKETMLLVPEINYSFGLTGPRRDLDWQIHQIRAGVAFKYSLPVPSIEPLPQPPEVITPPQRLPTLAAQLDAVSVQRGLEKQNLQITVEEFVTTQMRVLLPYVFFEENSSEIPSRYVTLDAESARRFGSADLHNRTTLEVYYQTLNTIGMRMSEHPKATLVLTGTNADREGEANDIRLSHRRASVLRDYLVDVWDIDTERITVAARNLPAIPSNPDDPDGLQENRRVEITSTSAAILAPVITIDTLRRVDPPLLRLKLAGNAEAGLESWEAAVMQGKDTLKRFAGKDSLPASLDWNIPESQANIPIQTIPLDARILLHDTEGNMVEGRDVVSVEQITIRRKREERLGDTLFQRFNLITFEFDRANLSRTTQGIISTIKASIPPGSIVDIAGYTDRVGNAEYNLDLSRQRALNTARSLSVGQEHATGLGETEVLYNNDLPEGRFLSRSVEVTVRTPIE